MAIIDEKPWYTVKGEASELLKYYMTTFKGDYKANKATAVIGLYPNVKGKKVLDIGCGGGLYSLAASCRGTDEIIVSDLQVGMVKAAKLNLSNKATLKVDGIVADAAHLPFREEYFDLVLCIDIIEHVQHDRAFLSDLHRVMSNGGFIIFSTQNSSSANYIIEHLIQRYIFKKVNWMGWDSTHLRFYTPSSLQMLLRTVDLKPTRLAGTYFIPYMFASSFRRFIGKRMSEALHVTLRDINNILEKRNTTLVGYFGWGLIISCKKLDMAVDKR